MTKQTPDCVNPVWNESFIFDCHDLKTLAMHLHIYNKHTVMSDDVGRTEHTLLSTLITTPKVIYESKPIDLAIGAGGSVTVMLRWIPQHNELHVDMERLINEMEAKSVIVRKDLIENHGLTNGAIDSVIVDLPKFDSIPKNLFIDDKHRLDLEFILGPSLGLSFGHTSWDTMVITGVRPNEQASKQGVKPSWELVAINGKMCTQYSDMVKCMADLTKGKKFDHTDMSFTGIDGVHHEEGSGPTKFVVSFQTTPRAVDFSCGGSPICTAMYPGVVFGNDDGWSTLARNGPKQSGNLTMLNPPIPAMGKSAWTVGLVDMAGTDWRVGVCTADQKANVPLGNDAAGWAFCSNGSFMHAGEKRVHKKDWKLTEKLAYVTITLDMDQDNNGTLIFDFFSTLSLYTKTTYASAFTNFDKSMLHIAVSAGKMGPTQMIKLASPHDVIE